VCSSVVGRSTASSAPMLTLFLSLRLPVHLNPGFCAGAPGMRRQRQQRLRGRRGLSPAHGSGSHRRLAAPSRRRSRPGCRSPHGAAGAAATCAFVARLRAQLVAHFCFAITLSAEDIVKKGPSRVVDDPGHRLHVSTAIRTVCFINNSYAHINAYIPAIDPAGVMPTARSSGMQSARTTRLMATPRAATSA